MLDKKVIYLDQFAVSAVFKMKRGLLQAGSNSFEFWQRAERAIDRAYLLQQAIFPSSHIHFGETVVWSSADDLRLAHAMLGGDTRFRRLEEIALQQIVPFAQAFLRQEKPPALTLRPDDVLVGSRNEWLPHLHISVNSDMSRFADGIRTNRDRASAEFEALAATWRKEKPTFDAVFQSELRAFAVANNQGLVDALERYGRAAARGDFLELFEAAHSPIYVQFMQLKSLFESMGVLPAQSSDEVVRYWRWPDNEWLPHHRAACYLFAAIARKMGAGQRRPPSRGMLNDINAISYFAPYVDAMFLDRECAGLLKEMPPQANSSFRAQVFSLTTGEAFIRYLDDLSEAASPETKRYAGEIYGIT